MVTLQTQNYKHSFIKSLREENFENFGIRTDINKRNEGEFFGNSEKDEEKKEKVIKIVTGAGIFGMMIGLGITVYASSFYPFVSAPQNVFTVLQELPKIIATQQLASSLLNTGLSIFVFSGLTTAALDYLISNAESIFHPGLKKKKEK
ncbi:MAG: hypothetical protein ACP5HJ_01380 [Candidatus Micrarchaeia archaeon]